MWKSKKVWIPAVATLLVATGVAVSMGRTKHEVHDDSAKGPAVLEFGQSDLAVAELRSLSRIIPVNGTLKPTTHAVLRSKITAIVTDVLVREGDHVTKGQVLAHFDNSNYIAQLHQQQGNLEVARAQLALDKRTNEKNAALLKQGFISGTNYDASQSNVEMSQARLKAAEAQVEVANIAMNDTVLRAPMSGVIGKRNIQPGEKVDVSSELLSIVDLSEMELQVTVPTTDIAGVKVGQTADFKVDGFADQVFTGTVRRINPEVEDGSRSILVFLSVKNPGGSLRGGMFAKGQLALGKSDPRLTIPVSAVMDGSGQPFVYWVDHGKIARANVTLGASDERSGLVEVDAGLQTGAPVVATRMDTVKPGTVAVIKSLPAQVAKKG